MKDPEMFSRQNIELLVPILEIQPVIPVVQIDDVADAVPLAEALLRGGIHVIEITLRSQAALGSIAAIVRQIPQMIIGAGTVLNQEQYVRAVEHGAKFIVSPGTNGALYGSACSTGVPLLPGVMTPGEIVGALNRGYHYLKFFPAQQAGGIDFVKALAGPFPDVKFCPTGGISSQNAPNWLDLPNVICVGGSWLAPRESILAKDWEAISQLAKKAVKLR